MSRQVWNVWWNKIYCMESPETRFTAKSKLFLTDKVPGVTMLVSMLYLLYICVINDCKTIISLQLVRVKKPYEKTTHNEEIELISHTFYQFEQGQITLADPSKNRCECLFNPC